MQDKFEVHMISRRWKGWEVKSASRIIAVTVIRLAVAAAGISCVPIMCEQLLEDHWIHRVSSDFRKKR